MKSITMPFRILLDIYLIYIVFSLNLKVKCNLSTEDGQLKSCAVF